jgi:hypothetical protein
MPQALSHAVLQQALKKSGQRQGFVVVAVVEDVANPETVKAVQLQVQL